MKKISLGLLALGLFFIPEVAQAGFLDSLSCIPSGNCGLNDIQSGFISLINLLLGGAGAVALLYFVYGASQWTISMGRADRVKKGTDIMINTGFALAVIFGSYLLLSFFINDLLQVDEQYQIESECTGAASGTTCNAQAGINYVCDGNGACITKCSLMSSERPYENWRCMYVEDLSSYLTAYYGIYSGDIELNLCPGTEHNVCVRHDDSWSPIVPEPIIIPSPGPTDPDWRPDPM